MSKRILSLLMVMAMILSLVNLAAAVEAEQTQTVQTETVIEQPAPEQEAEIEQEVETEAEAEVETDVEVETEVEEELPPAVCFYVNEQPVYKELYWLNDVAYAPVRPIFEAALPGCEIRWEDGQAVIVGETADGETLSVAARPGKSYVEANGRYLYVPDGVQLIDSTTMIPLTVLAQMFNGTVGEDEQGVPVVTLGEGLLTAGKDYYDAEQMDLLSRLIFSESGNQSMLGKVAVGNVVLNRVESALFPNTLYNVIYQRGQFSVVNSGAINRTPNADSVIAAKLCLEGTEVTEALFFNTRGLRCWAAQHRPYIATIGNHDFYA